MCVFWVHDAAFTRFIHRADQCRGNYYADRFVLLLQLRNVMITPTMGVSDAMRTDLYATKNAGRVDMYFSVGCIGRS